MQNNQKSAIEDLIWVLFSNIMKFLQLIFLNTDWKRQQAFINKNIYLEKHLFAWESKIHLVAALRRNYSEINNFIRYRENLIHLNILRKLFST